MYQDVRCHLSSSVTLTNVVAFDGAEHAEGLNQPAAVLQKAVQVGTRAKLITENTRKA